MPNEDHPNILAPHQPPGTFARLRAKAFADRERKAKEEEARKNNGEQQQKGEEQIKETSSSSSAPESRPGFRPSLLKPRPVFPGTMNIAILNDDWTLPLDQVDLKARRQREVYLARELLHGSSSNMSRSNKVGRRRLRVPLNRRTPLLAALRRRVPDKAIRTGRTRDFSSG